MRFNFRGILRLGVMLSLVNAALWIGGCESRPAAAQKMFAQGKYQEVATQFADLEIGRRARAKLAEQLIAVGEYDSVLSAYPDTPAAYQARVAKSELLLREGKYDEIIEKYVNTAAGTKALDFLADSLTKAGHADVFLSKYAETERGKEIRETMAKASFDSVMALKGDAKIKGLEFINSTYMATAVYKMAMKELDNIRNPTINKPKTTPPKKTK